MFNLKILMDSSMQLKILSYCVYTTPLYYFLFFIQEILVRTYLPKISIIIGRVESKELVYFLLGHLRLLQKSTVTKYEQ